MAENEIWATPDSIWKDRAWHLDRILQARRLPATTGLGDLAKGADEVTRLFLAELPGYPEDLVQAESLYSIMQKVCVEQEAGLTFPGLYRETFAGTVTGPQQGGRLVVILDSYASGKSPLLGEIATAAHRRGLHTLSPSGTHWVPGSEAIAPSKLAKRLRQLHRTLRPGKQVAILIDDYDRFEKAPHSLTALKVAERYGYRIFVSCQDLTRAMLHDPTFPRGAYMATARDGSIREWGIAQRERYLQPTGRPKEPHARRGLVGRVLSVIMPARSGNRLPLRSREETRADRRAA